MKNIVKNILKIVLIFLVSITIGFSLLVFVYLLPVDSIKNNVIESIPSFERELYHYQDVLGFDTTKLDNYTDIMILQEAIYSGSENVLEKAIKVYRDDFLNNGYLNSLLAIDKDLELVKKEYSRYWNGLLVIYKPLLTFFNYQEIRMMNSYLVLIIISLVIYSFVKKKLDKYIPAYLVSLVLLNPFVISKSFQFSTIFYIYNIALIVMLKYHDKLKLKNRYLYYFLIIGIITSYFDYLSAPILTFCMPLIVLTLLNKDKSLKDKFKDLILYGFMWLLGYGLFWIFKWVIGSVILNENLFEEALLAFKKRTSLMTYNEDLTRFTGLNSNLLLFNNLPNLVLLIGVVIYLIIKIIKNKLRFSFDSFLNNLSLLIIFFIPIIWLLLTPNHSYLHAYFSYRILVVCIFSLLVFIISILKKR